MVQLGIVQDSLALINTEIALTGVAKNMSWIAWVSAGGRSVATEVTMNHMLEASGKTLLMVVTPLIGEELPKGLRIKLAAEWPDGTIRTEERPITEESLMLEVMWSDDQPEQPKITFSCSVA